MIHTNTANTTTQAGPRRLFSQFALGTQQLPSIIYRSWRQQEGGPLRVEAGMGHHRDAGPVPRGTRTPSMTGPATPPASQTPLEPRIADHPQARPRAPLARERAFFLQLRDHALSASLRIAEALSELGNRRARILTEEPEGTGPRSVAFTRGFGEREHRLADRLEHELNGSLTRPARAFCTSRMSRGSPSTRCPSRTALTARSSRLFPSIMSEEQIVWILSSRRSAGLVARGARHWR